MTTTTKTTAARKPADRKVSQADQLAAEAGVRAGDLPEGAEGLLKPVEELRSTEQAEANAELIELFQAMGVDITKTTADGDEPVEQEVEVTPETVRAMGQIATVLERYAVDTQRFADFDRGKGAMQRMSALAMWFLNELGE